MPFVKPKACETFGVWAEMGTKGPWPVLRVGLELSIFHPSLSFAVWSILVLVVGLFLIDSFVFMTYNFLLKSVSSLSIISIFSNFRGPSLVHTVVFYL